MEKEKLGYHGESEILWPHANKVEVGPSVDFIYIMRKDGDFAMSPVAQAISDDYLLDRIVVRQKLLENYDNFFGEFADILKWGFATKGKFQLHLYEASYLEQGVRKKADGCPIVSLDPLMNSRVYEHCVSRGYYPGGTKDLGQVSRPGKEDSTVQAEHIANILNGEQAVLVEDDIFSGGSVIASITQLQNAGVNIKKLVPGIQVGKPDKLTQMGVSVDPVVEYVTTDSSDIFNKVDLGDPRDYLLGASGLVIKMANGDYARAPYILPFVSTAARAGISKDLEKDFALKVLIANYHFFQNADSSIGEPVLIKHMDKNFACLMTDIFGFDANTPMSQVAVWALNNLDTIWEKIRMQGEFQEKLSQLHLPQDLVFIDINGTLIPDEAKDGFIPPEDVSALRDRIKAAKEKGMGVGLCSDSPLPQILEFSKKIGFEGPMIAENGNLIFNDGKALEIGELASLDAIKGTIISASHELSLTQLEDSIATEFGGTANDYTLPVWSFGANRVTSVSVFGPSEFIQNLGEKFKNVKGISIDVSPEYNYFAVHPGSDYRKNKGNTLNILSQYGHRVVMIGNSTSDWSGSETQVLSTFVAGSRISDEIKLKAAYVSDKPLARGVADILNRIK